MHVIGQITEGEIGCALDSDFVKKVVTLDKIPEKADRFGMSFGVTEPNQFTLLFANCVPGLRVSMDVHSSMYNFDAKSGSRTILF